jgi:hypothetical protein
MKMKVHTALTRCISPDVGGSMFLQKVSVSKLGHTAFNPEDKHKHFHRLEDLKDIMKLTSKVFLDTSFHVLLQS